MGCCGSGAKHSIVDTSSWVSIEIQPDGRVTSCGNQLVMGQLNQDHSGATFTDMRTNQQTIYEHREAGLAEHFVEGATNDEGWGFTAGAMEKSFFDITDDTNSRMRGRINNGMYGALGVKDAKFVIYDQQSKILLMFNFVDGAVNGNFYNVIANQEFL